jgi:prolyl-tRNA synthetase
VDYEDAEREIQEELSVWSALSKKLCLPYVLSRRPDWDKFPGAYYTTAADALVPGNAPGEWRTLQVATVHHYRDNFSKAYGIAYENEAGEHVPAHQTTYGMSERLLGAVVGIHGDEKGLRLPPDIAPTQGAIVPILFRGKEAPVLEGAKAVRDSLASAGFRVHLDLREETAGFKFNDWEMRGVPIRIEIGPRDLEKKQVVLVRRDDGSKETVALDRLSSAFGEALRRYGEGLTEAARKNLDSNVRTIQSLDEARSGTGILRTFWCGAEACGVTMQDKSEKAVLGVPVEIAFPTFALKGDSTLRTEAVAGGPCVVCGAPGKPVRLAKSY